MTFINRAVIDKAQYKRRLAQFMQAITPGAISTLTGVNYFASMHESATASGNEEKAENGDLQYDDRRNDLSSLHVKRGLLRRRHSSFAAKEDRKFSRSPLAEMQVDVELCGQLLIARRRDARLELTLKALQVNSSKIIARV